MDATAGQNSVDFLDASKVERLRRRMLSPWGMRAYFAARLPLAWFAGLRVRELSTERCRVMVPRGWRTTNPFRSTYFAALAMAAELSTGALALLATEASPASVSMLVVRMGAEFEKKTVADATFGCDEGQTIFTAVRETARTGEPVTAEVETVGRLPDGTVVARFTFVWSFRRREA